MHLVNQITPFTCGLACIESITTDWGKSVSQSESLVRFKKELITHNSDMGNFGATSTSAIEIILSQLGYLFAWIKDHRKDLVRDEKFKKIDLQKQAIIIISNYEKNGWHCIRYAGLKDDDSIFATVPEFGSDKACIKEISIQNLIDWDYGFWVIER